MDCGTTLFDINEQDVGSGGSGCGCSAVTLASYILPKVENGEWKKYEKNFEVEENCNIYANCLHDFEF